MIAGAAAVIAAASALARKPGGYPSWYSNTIVSAIIRSTNSSAWATLMKRGWTTARVEKLLGRNLLRLYGEVWGG